MVLLKTVPADFGPQPAAGSEQPAKKGSPLWCSQEARLVGEVGRLGTRAALGLGWWLPRPRWQAAVHLSLPGAVALKETLLDASGTLLLQAPATRKSNCEAYV